jgi:adenylate kinase
VRRGEKQQNKNNLELGLILQKPNTQETPTEKQKPKPITTTTHPNTFMKRVILITGTPCTGKTTLSKQLTTKLDALYINLTDFAKDNSLTLGEDKQRNTTIIDETKMRKKLAQTITQTQKGTVIVDGHYASAVVSPTLATHVFVLRRNPVELKEFMQKCKFSEAKLYENLSAEILDVCLVEALQMQEGKVCELDVTGRTVEETVNEVLAVLAGEKKCISIGVDWLGMLERKGLTDQYLKT